MSPRSHRQRTGSEGRGGRLPPCPAAVVRRLRHVVAVSCWARFAAPGPRPGHGADAGRHLRARPCSSRRTARSCVHVITAPRPGDQNGLYQLAPVLARRVGDRRPRARDADRGDRLGQRDGRRHQRRSLHRGDRIRRDLHAGRRARAPPLADALARSASTPPAACTSTASKFFGTWKGTGQRRPLAGLNQTPAAGQVVLFTPAWGAPVPHVPDAAEVVARAVPGRDAEHRPRLRP